MLLCPNPFGSHFGLMYQRFFAKHAVDANVVFEWTIFDVASLDFPTQAMQRCFDGFFVCGAPDVSHAVADHIAHRSAPWYTALVDFVRALVAQDRPVGALGRGHVVLAEALGGRIVRRSTWQRANNVLEEKVTTGFKQVLTRVRSLHTLHGEYVASLSHPTIRAVSSLPIPGSMYPFVSCMKTKHVLSYDGYPECNSLVFDLLSRVFDPDHGTSLNLFKKTPSGSAGSIALNWVSAGPMVAHQFIQLYIPGAVARSKASHEGGLRSVIHNVRNVAVAIYAMKSPVPHVDFISDTEEYISFAINEHVESIVLGINLSRDDHPIVFPRSCLNDMTDVVEVFPSLFYSPTRKKHRLPNQHHEIAQVHIPRLTLHELKSLTILHAYQSRHVVKSPRLIPGSSSSSHNRLLTLYTALKRIAEIFERQRQVLHPSNYSSAKAGAVVPPLHVTFTFPDEDSPTFVNYSPLDIQRWWRVLNGAIAALNHPTLLTKLTIVSRDATLLQILRKMQPAWDYVFVLPVVTTFQNAMDVRRHAKIFARFADGILLQKNHEFIACPSPIAHRMGPIDLVSVVDLYRDVGLRVFVNANSSENVTTTILGATSGPVREQLAFVLLGVDGIFTSNPHPVQDARKLFAENHSVVDEVREAIHAHCLAASEKMELNRSAECEHLTNDDGYRLYAHHYYNLPLESHEFAHWQERRAPHLTSQHTSLLVSLDAVLDHIDRLHAVDVAAEACRQQLNVTAAPPLQPDNLRRDLSVAVKTPTLDQVRRLTREKPLRLGKRNRSVGLAFRSRHFVLDDNDESKWKALAVQQIPARPPKPTITTRLTNPALHQHRTSEREDITPMSSLETRTPSMVLSEKFTPSPRRRRILHSINLPVCSI
ncbi:hypothetical protein DYB32_001706 [Aphanomyces invadans]|uniref:GP-PDE domain-containing protein n=1 Tax=Aphanomyces invadans TaxID=157072 RepID=A0A418B5C4_9STRA|nr:hypothetical protein DYB32_001706 [Aphanomyces invadans]